MTNQPDIQTGYNLMLCLYARGDKEKMKKHFLKLLTIAIPGMTDDDDDNLNLHTLIINDDILNEKNDLLKDELLIKKEYFNEKILIIARLISPIIEEDWLTGYNWIMDNLKPKFEDISSKLEIDLSMEYMKQRRYDDAIDILKSFEKKDPTLRAMASTNLSFIYFLETDLVQAEKYADLAIKSDRYNAKALVNKGMFRFMKF